MRFAQEAVEVGHSPVLRIDGFVVGDVVSEIDLRGRVDRAQPDRVHAQRLHVVEALRDALQVADARAVAILEAARIDFVDEGVFPPRLGAPCV